MTYVEVKLWMLFIAVELLSVSMTLACTADDRWRLGLEPCAGCDSDEMRSEGKPCRLARA